MSELAPTPAWITLSGLQSGRYRVRSVPGFEAEQVAALLREHRRVVAEGGPQLVQDRRWRPVTRIILGGEEYAVKQYGRGSPGARIRRIVAGSRARRAWDRQRELARRGVPVAQAIAYVDAPLITGPVESYLFSRWMPGGFVSQTVAGLAAAGDNGARWRLIEAAGRFVASLHRQGIWFEDLWDQNVLMPPDGTPGPSFVVVDCDSAHAAGLTGPRQLRNLRQFSRAFRRAAAQSDYLRYALAYMQALGYQSLHHRELLRPILALLLAEGPGGQHDRLCGECWRVLGPMVDYQPLGLRRHD